MKTLVTFLLDRSGSMESIRDDTIGAFNAYLDGLKQEPAGIEFSFLLFDTMSVDKLQVSEPVANVPALNRDVFVPRGGTPLIDAAYGTIKAVEEALTKRDDAPKVVICIQTDGHENSSTAHGWDDLNAMIKEKTAAGWQFNFMGAGIDAYDQGARMGIAAGSTMSYDSSDPFATRAAFAANASNTTAFASGRAASTRYSAAQKLSAGDKFDPLRRGTPRPKARPPRQSIVDKISL